MVRYEDIKKRSPMYVSIDSRLLGVGITVFVLILTLRKEILNDTLIILQLVLSLPFLIGAMMSNAKIVDMDSFKEYYLFNRVCYALGNAFIFNTLGLLISKYVSYMAGVAFFLLVGLVILEMMLIGFNKRKMYNEFLMLVVLILLGLIPAVGLIKF